MGEEKRRRATGAYPEKSRENMEAKLILALKEPALIMIFKRPDDGVMECDLAPSPPYDSHIAYGILVADLVRHIARCFEVSIDEVMVEVTDQLINHPDVIEGGRVVDDEDFFKRSSWKKPS